ncbi:unnamed protein product [Rotaria sordida]|uniref:WD repeat-containing protein 7 n=1 Tax=Rotaria sordida TaxID=392033 RepID=A0A813YN05_9BILA|nr:unnamed protein product [Rotaria sordida]
MACSSRILLPFALWPENPPSLSVSSLFINFASDDLITGTNDGFIVCWKILSDHQKIIPRLMLIGHTNQVSFIVASTSTHQLEQFISISDNDGEIKSWNNEDGHCIEHIRTNLKHRSAQCFNYQLTNENFLICCGCYSEILIYDMRTLEIKYTLTPSNVNADWISTFFVFQKANAPDVIIAIGLLDSGCVKLWAFDPRTATSNTAIEGTSIGNNNNILPIDLKEHESKEIRTQFGSIIVPCEECQRMMLIVYGQGWQIFDGIDFTELCSYVMDDKDIVKNEHWINGYFPTPDLVILFSARGYGHIFRLPENATFMNPKFRSQHNKGDMQLPQWLCRLNVGNELKLAQTPIFSCHTKLKQCQVYRADSSGQISVWHINLKKFSTDTDILPTYSISYKDTWSHALTNIRTIKKILNDILPCKINKLTASCHLITMDRLAFGTDNGKIYIVPALKLILSLFSNNNQQKENFDIQTLSGHNQTITCLIHPHSEYSRYDIQHLVSGSIDHSIRLWDLATNTQLHMFTVHSGTILMFHIPPPMLNIKVQYCICAIASDHSVSLLSLKERKLILLANRQSYPVVGLRWRINDDFLLIKCSDGSLFIWQIETGNLDRVEHGILAEELFDWYNDLRILSANNDLQNDPLSTATVPSHYLQIRSTGKRKDNDQLRKLYRRLGTSRQDLMGTSFKHTEYRLPIIIQQFHTNLGDDLAILILFDLLQLISQIIVFDLEKQHAQKSKQIEIANKDTRPQLDQTSTSLSILSNLLVSLLHPWSFDKNIDRICQERLRLNRVNRLLSYGILSKNEHLTIVLPTWQQYLNDHVPEAFLSLPTTLISFAGMETDDDATLKQKQERMETYVYHWRWKYSTILNTEHLLSSVTMVYILMNCDRWINNIPNDQDEQALLSQRESWSKLLQFYCSDMLEQCQTNVFQSLSIEILCSHWQDLCLELRDAARKLLEKELDHLHNNNDAWHIFISKWSNLFNQSYNKETDGALYDQDIRDIFLDDMTYNNETTATTTTAKEQYKTQQLLSIILIGIVGTRYGQEVEQTKQASVAIKGFTVDSPEMILKLSRILTSLLSPSNFDHIPLHSVIRRTAIDLIGRGYTIWEPYLDIGQVLLTLLDLCAISDSSTVTSKRPNVYTSSVLSGILTPKTDTCLTARTALNLIATSRSNVVIITLAREIAKYVLAQSGTTSSTTARTTTPSQASITIKNEQKTEILRLIRILIEKCPHDVAELILEVTDIILNCIDLSTLRHKGVQVVSETFGLLLRYPIVTYCHESPKLCVGTKTGILALYDLKTPKYQPFQAHPKNEVITCVEFSPDGKYLASYSAYEGILYFWQTSSNTFFGSSNTIHLVSRHAAQRLDRSIPSPMKKVDLNWIDRTSVRMYWHVDKSEKKFTV